MSFYKTVIGCFDKYFSTQSKCLHEVNFAFYFSTSAPSSAPTNFTVTARSSTQSMNFKYWLSLLLVMDLKVLLRL